MHSTKSAPSVSGPPARQRLARLPCFLLLLLSCTVPVSHAGEDFHLNAQETRWLLSHPSVMRRGADGSWPPFEFLDSQGIYAGMCQDYADLVAERLHLTFEVVPGLSWKEVLDQIGRAHV